MQDGVAKKYLQFRFTPRTCFHPSILQAGGIESESRKAGGKTTKTQSAWTLDFGLWTLDFGLQSGRRRGSEMRLVGGISGNVGKHGVDGGLERLH